MYSDAPRAAQKRRVYNIRADVSASEEVSDMGRVIRFAALCSLLVLVIVGLSSHVVHGRSAATPPPLAAPSGTIVNVSTEAELQAALRQLSSNTTIVLAPGTYPLSRTLSVDGTLSNIGIRGGTGNADDVVIAGRGMANASYGDVPDGMSFGGGVQGVLVANLTIRDIYRQAIVLNAGTQSARVYNVHLVDAGEAFIRSNPTGQSGGADNGIVEYSVIEYSTAGRDLTASAVDLHAGANWTIRHNLFRNIVVAPGEIAGPAVLARDYSSNTLTEGNRFVNCARAIAYGLSDKPNGFDHAGGVIRNNFVYRAADQPGDVAISVADSPATKVVNNTVFVSGTYSTPIEYRFADTTGVLVANNLLDGFLWARDGAVGAEQSNLVGASQAMFVNAAAGDLHLSASAIAAIDHGADLADVIDDWDGELRAAPQDIGADEYANATPRAAAAATLTVAMTEPVTGATVTGTAVVVTASATDPSGSGIAGVQFKLDGADLNAEETELPYSIVWNTTRASNGTHTLTAVARNWAGVTTTAAPVTVTVSNDVTAPLVSMTAPVAGATVSGATVTVSANATDNVGVAGVQFKLDGANLGAEDTTRPFSRVWNSTKSANGSHTLTAVARDAAGNKGTAAVLSVIVKNPDITAPTVSITAPLTGATVSGTTVTITATAADNIGVAGVQFKVDGVNAGVEDTAKPYATAWNITAAANGTHTITAVARDAAGNTATAAAVTVTVSNPVAGVCPCSLWSAAAKPARVETTDTSAVEVGVRFRADTSGTVTGIRFYKGAGNTGAHVGNLWSNTGTLLASAAFVNETASGWQQVIFSAPVAVTANTTYVASYHTNVGQYAVTDGYFATTGVDAVPLHAPANGAAGANAVYVYGASAFPTQTYQSANYWVDVVFSSAGSDTTRPAVAISAPASAANVGGAAVAVAATASDNVGVVGVQFKLDGANLGAEDTTSPYGLSWNTAGVANGTHTLTAVARDAAGNVTVSSAVTVAVNNVSSQVPTTVVFQASADHATSVSRYVLDAFANGADPYSASPVATVDLGKPTPQANGDVTVDEASFFNGLPAGTYLVTISAIGPTGVGRSAGVTITR